MYEELEKMLLDNGYRFLFARRKRMTLTKCDNCGKIVHSAFACRTESISKYYNFDLCRECLYAILAKREKLEKERDEAS